MDITVVTFLVWIRILPKTSNALLHIIQITYTHTLLPIISQIGVASSANGLDPAVLAALVGLAGVVVGALLAGAFATYQLRYQIRRNTQLELQRQADQFKHEQEMLRLQKELEERSKLKEREQQRQETAAEIAHAAMQHALTIDERVKAYRKALRTDPRIARLQILDMNRPLEVTDIYIHLRLHEETRPGYNLEPTVGDAGTRHDPNIILKASKLRLEHRSVTALAPEEAIRKYQHCIIVGDPGAGKTTLLKYLALQSIDHRLSDLPDLPIHIELNAFATSDHRDLLEFAATVWENCYSFPKVEALEYTQAQLQEGKAMLLLDALDETVEGTTREEAEEAYLSVSKAITDVATRYHQAPIVVTARKAGYHQRTRLVGFTELEALDFCWEEIKQFVERWYASHPDPHKRSNVTELNRKLERNARMQALAANPLLLSLIVIVYEDQLDLPERRAELYKQCVDTLLTKWDASRNIRRLRAFKPEHKRQLLEEVAWHFHLQGQRYFPQNELLDVIAAFLPAVGLKPEQNEQVLDEIAAENGLLKEQARGWQGFLHLTLQEYFVAQYMVDHQQLETLLRRRDDPWWEEVLLLYAGRVPDASQLLEHLLGLSPSNKIQDDLFHTNLILAGRCLAAYPTVRQTSLREEVISRLFRALKAARYSLEQQQVSETLAEIGGVEVNVQLVQLLSDKRIEEDMRSRIADALGNLGERSVASGLVQLLSDSQIREIVRGRIADALGNLGERSVAPQLVQLLSDSRLEEIVRRRITSALTMLINDEEQIRALAALFFNSDIADSLYEALWVLSRKVGVRIFVSDSVLERYLVIVKML